MSAEPDGRDCALVGLDVARSSSREVRLKVKVNTVERDKKRAIAMAHLALVAAGTPATPEARGYTDCPCPKKCTLHGECHFCVAYHGRKGVLPRCER
jgi:hypothetical protein